MLVLKDKGFLLQIIKRCNRVIDKVSNITEVEFSLNDDIKEIVFLIYFKLVNLQTDYLMNLLKLRTKSMEANYWNEK